jgi:hypothetical protein
MKKVIGCTYVHVKMCHLENIEHEVQEYIVGDQDL